MAWLQTRSSISDAATVLDAVTVGRDWALCRRACIANCCVLVVFAIGCGGSDVGPARYAVEGTVTLDGTPVDRAEISFIPDTSAGNAGPAAYGFAKNGEFRIPAKIGPVAGPSNVRVTVYAGDSTTKSLGSTTLSEIVEPIDLNVLELSITDSDLESSRRTRGDGGFEGDGDVEADEED